MGPVVELDREVGVEGVGNPEKRVDPRRSSTAFQARDGGLRRADERGQVGLGQAARPPPAGDLSGDLREEPALFSPGEPGADPLDGSTHISKVLYIAIVRYGVSIAVVSYVAFMLVWIFWILDRQVFFGEPLGDLLVVIALGVLHVVAGFLAGRWWILFMPFVFVLVSIPLGYPATNMGEPFPMWWSLLAATPIAIALLALGVALRSLGPWRGGLGVR